MNRQVGPSIVLSVLIVCFFAVALYQRDPPAAPRHQARSTAAESIARAGSTPLPGPSGASLIHSETAKQPRPVPGRREIAVRPIALASDASIRAFEPAQAHSSCPPADDFVGSDDSMAGWPFEDARRPASAFTTVMAHETLEHVARRVYGSERLAGSLWRANRDALSRKESPLAAGMVLRTPIFVTQNPLRK